MKENKAKRKIFVTSLLAALLIFGLWALLYYDKKFNLHEISLSRLIHNREAITNVKCSVVQSFGKKSLLSIKMAIPCENDEQLTDLTNKMHIIKSDFLTNFDQKRLEEWVRNGNLGAIKTELLKIVNHYADKPVENLYFESFISR